MSKRTWRSFWAELDRRALEQVRGQLDAKGWQIEEGGPPWVAHMRNCGSWPRLIASDPIELARKVEQYEADAAKRSAASWQWGGE